MSLKNIIDGLSSEEARERVIAVAVKKGLTITDEHVDIAKKYLNKQPRNERLFAKIALEKGNYEEAIEKFSEIGMYKESADILVQHIGDIQKAIDLLTKETKYQHVRDGDGWERARQSLSYAVDLAKQHNLPEKEQKIYEKFASGLIKTMGMTHECDLDSFCADSGFEFFRNFDDEEIKINLGKKIIELDLKEEKGYVAGQMYEVLNDKEGAITHYLDFFKEDHSRGGEAEKAHNAKKRAEQLIEDLPEQKKKKFLEDLISFYEERDNLSRASDICLELGRYEQAIRYLESIGGCDGQVAHLYEKIGEVEKAKKIYEDLAKEFIKKKPEDRGYFAGTNAARFALKAGDIDLAITGYLKDEDYIEAVKLCIEHGKTVRARKIYKKGIIHYEEGLHIELAKELAEAMEDQKRIGLYNAISEEIGEVESTSLY